MFKLIKFHKQFLEAVRKNEGDFKSEGLEYFEDILVENVNIYDRVAANKTGFFKLNDKYYVNTAIEFIRLFTTKEDKQKINKAFTAAIKGGKQDLIIKRFYTLIKYDHNMKVILDYAKNDANLHKDLLFCVNEALKLTWPTNKNSLQEFADILHRLSPGSCQDKEILNIELQYTPKK